MLWGEPLQPLEKVAGRVRDVKAVVRQAAAGRLLDLYRRSLARSPDSLTISPGAFSLVDLSPNASAGQLRPSERGCNLIQLKTTFIVSSQTISSPITHIRWCNDEAHCGTSREAHALLF